MKITFEKNKEGFKRPGTIPTLMPSVGKGGYKSRQKTIEKFKIEQWDAISLEFIKEWDSIFSAASTLEMGIDTIKRSMKSGEPDYRGTCWVKKGELFTGPKPRKIRKGVIEQWDSVSNVLVNTWRTLKEAATALNRDAIVLRKCIEGGEPDWKGFIWKRKLID
jgi:hypothetical protein